MQEGKTNPQKSATPVQLPESIENTNFATKGMKNGITERCSVSLVTPVRSCVEVAIHTTKRRFFCC
jgi:hypothetical protein